MFIAVLSIIAKCWKQPNGSKNCGTFTQWNTMQQKERRSSYPLRQHGWNWRALCRVVCIFLIAHLNPATFQLLASHMWLATTVWNRPILETFGLFSSQTYSSKWSKGLRKLAISEISHFPTLSLQLCTQYVVQALLDSTSPLQTLLQTLINSPY